MHRRVVAYIDGLNLYHGLCDGGFHDRRWLDVTELMRLTLDPGEELVGVRYFNAPAWDSSKRARQAVYLDALRAGGVEVVLGVFREKYWWCDDCGEQNTRHEEKRTDVAIGTRLIHDLYTSEFEVAVLVTGDSDIVAAIAIARQVRPIQIRAIFPPRRGSADLKKSADNHRRIKEKHLAAALLDNPVIAPDGGAIYQPTEWVGAPRAWQETLDLEVEE